MFFDRDNVGHYISYNFSNLVKDPFGKMKIICKTRLYIYHIQYLFSFSNFSSETKAMVCAVKDHMGYSFRLAAMVLFYMYHPTDRIAHTMPFVTPVVEYWLKREIAQWVHHEGSI